MDSPPTLKQVTAHARDRDYMSRIERDKLRVKATGEVFTPTKLVQEILDEMPQEIFEEKEKTFIDPACGDGQFLSEVLIRKMQNGIGFLTALATIYGVDIMEDNIDLCRERLACGSKHPYVWKILNRNIICDDALKLFSEDGLPFKDGLPIQFSPKTLPLLAEVEEEASPAEIKEEAPEKIKAPKLKIARVALENLPPAKLATR